MWNVISIYWLIFCCHECQQKSSIRNVNTSEMFLLVNENIFKYLCIIVKTLRVVHERLYHYMESVSHLEIRYFPSNSSTNSYKMSSFKDIVPQYWGFCVFIKTFHIEKQWNFVNWCTLTFLVNQFVGAVLYHSVVLISDFPLIVLPESNDLLLCSENTFFF